MMNRKWIALVLACFIPSVMAANYKWTDESGQVNYGTTPPAGVKAERVKSDGPSSSAAQEIEKLQQRQKAEAENKANQEMAQAKREKILEKKRIWKANCNAAKQNLASLQQKPRVRKRDAYGDLVIIPEKELKTQIDDAQKEVDLHCNPPSFEGDL